MQNRLIAALLGTCAFLPTIANTRGLCFIDGEGAEPAGNVVDRGAVVRTPKKAAKPKAAAKAKPKAAAKKDKAPAKTASDSDIFDREKYQYEARAEKTAGGRRSVNSGDRLALALMGKSAADVIKMLKPNGLEAGNWSHLNEGMQKMNATNKLRALVKSGGKVTIDGKVIASLGK